MNRCTTKLFAALFTFSIGIITVFGWQFLNTPLLTALPSNSVQTATSCYFSDVDMRLMNAVRRVHLKDIETNIKRRNITEEQAEKFRAYADSPQLTKWLRKDIENTNDGCDRDGLTLKQCNERKEAAIRDIEENILPDKVELNENDALRQWRESRGNLTFQMKDGKIQAMRLTEK